MKLKKSLLALTTAATVAVAGTATAVAEENTPSAGSTATDNNEAGGKTETEPNKDGDKGNQPAWTALPCRHPRCSG